MNRHFVAAFVLVLSLAGLLPSRAGAQDTLTYDVGPGSWCLGQDEIRALTEILGLSTEQALAARELLRGAKAELQVIERRSNRATMPQYALAWSQGDKAQQARDQMKKNQERSAESCEKVERQFFADVRSLLDDAQLARWPNFERARRRMMLQWMNPPASADLSAILRAIKLTDEERPILATAIERYESEVDVLLLERRAVTRPLKVWLQGYGFGNDASPADEEAQKRLAESEARLAAVQKTHAQLLAGHLGRERGAVILAAVETGRIWFGPFADQPQFREILRLKGVTDDQRSAIRRVMVAGDAEFRRVTADFAATAEKRDAGTVSDEEFQKDYQRASEQYVEVRDKSWDKALALLTPEQRSGYEDGTDPATEDAEDRDARGWQWWK